MDYIPCVYANIFVYSMIYSTSYKHISNAEATFQTVCLSFASRKTRTKRAKNAQKFRFAKKKKKIPQSHSFKVVPKTSIFGFYGILGCPKNVDFWILLNFTRSLSYRHLVLGVYSISILYPIYFIYIYCIYCIYSIHIFFLHLFSK